MIRSAPELLSPLRRGPGLTLEYSKRRPTAGAVTVSQTIDVSTAKSTVDHATGVKCTGVYKQVSLRGRRHASALLEFQGR